MNAIFRMLSVFFIIIFFVYLSAFSTLSLTHKEASLPNLPSGNPDLSVGVVVRPDSTGIDVLADSSENIRFIVVNGIDRTEIMGLSTHMLDYSPHSLSFIDEKYGFKTGPIHNISVVFGTSGTDTPVWSHFYFYAFKSSASRTKEEVIEILDKWVTIFDEAGWTRIEYPEPTDPESIRYFVLPTKDGLNDDELYCSWITDSGFSAKIWVKLYKKIEYSPIKKIKKSEVDIYSALISINNSNAKKYCEKEGDECK